MYLLYILPTIILKWTESYTNVLKMFSDDWWLFPHILDLGWTRRCRTWCAFMFKNSIYLKQHIKIMLWITRGRESKREWERESELLKYRYNSTYFGNTPWKWSCLTLEGGYCHILSNITWFAVSIRLNEFIQSRVV